MKITLIAKSVASASIESLQKSEEKKRTKISVKLENEIFENQKKATVFRVRYVSSVTIEGIAQVEVAYNFDFESESEFSEELVKSDVMKVTAPSLAYPYIKIYVENLISMSGLGNFTLPYFDFFESPFE
ncbi:MAG: protein-export chaperone SecB [Pantoea sp.]|uniref:SMODS-associated NUDIX domain-containing protein n=1 Tax=Pantoea sp. TaxID=69393 RepID=UPI0039E3A1AF